MACEGWSSRLCTPLEASQKLGKEPHGQVLSITAVWGVQQIMGNISLKLETFGFSKLAIHMEVCFQGKLQEALDELLIAEEAFGLCNPTHLPLIDNLGLLSLDIVW